jgi:hypothetical protein
VFEPPEIAVFITQLNVSQKNLFYSILVKRSWITNAIYLIITCHQKHSLLARSKQVADTE